MKDTISWEDLRPSRGTEEERQTLDRAVEQITERRSLKELRKHCGETQTSLAKRLDMTQSQVSRFEKRTDHRISALRRYIEALGGDLELVAVFDDGKIKLR